MLNQFQNDTMTRTVFVQFFVVFADFRITTVQNKLKPSLNGRGSVAI